jgi:anti-sigma B factor antagonist
MQRHMGWLADLKRRDWPVATYTIDVVPPDSETPTVVLRRELDLASRPELRACATRALASGASAIRFDLAEVTLLDSSVLGVLLESTASSVSAMARVVITAASRFVARTLDITGLGSYFLPTASDGTAPTPATARPYRTGRTASALIGGR